MTVQYRAERTQSGGPTEARLARIIAEQEEIFVRRQPQSARLAAQAKGRLWLISVQHDEADIERLVENFGVFARAVGR